MKEIPVSEFQAKCLAVLRRVQKTSRPVRITRRGKPVAEVVPIPQLDKPRKWMGSMKGQVEILGDIVSPATEPQEWEVLRD